MAYRDQKQALRALTGLASAQGGYFTAKQADEAGYAPSHLSYHVDSGNFMRVGRGLYRIPTIPTSEYDDLIQLSLWSRGRDDRPQAVVSHESALSIYELSDILPGKVHLTVPPSFRKPPPGNCVLHRARLTNTDSVAWSGFRVTTSLRTLIDVAAADSVSTDEIKRAVHDAIEKGLVIRKALRAAARDAGADSRLSVACDAVA